MTIQELCTLLFLLRKYQELEAPGRHLSESIKVVVDSIMVSPHHLYIQNITADEEIP